MSHASLAASNYTPAIESVLFSLSSPSPIFVVSVVFHSSQVLAGSQEIKSRVFKIMKFIALGLANNTFMLQSEVVRMLHVHYFNNSYNDPVSVLIPLFKIVARMRDGGLLNACYLSLW